MDSDMNFFKYMLRHLLLLLLTQEIDDMLLSCLPLSLLNRNSLVSVYAALSLVKKPLLLSQLMIQLIVCQL